LNYLHKISPKSALLKAFAFEKSFFRCYLNEVLQSFVRKDQRFTMNIISGFARNLTLADLPDSEIRPTSGRARKALFDSLGDFRDKKVLDLCSGSGALALEAVSRGAQWAVMIEKSPAHTACIQENCRRLRNVMPPEYAAGDLTVVQSDILDVRSWIIRLQSPPDLIFSDPPYPVSAELFRKLLSDKKFCSGCAGAKLIWEIPDSRGAMGEFINNPALEQMQFRRFGSTIFLLAVITLHNDL